MKETGSCLSSPSEAGLIENQITVLDTKAALGPWQELPSTALRSRHSLGPRAELWGAGPRPLCHCPLSPCDPLPFSFLSLSTDCQDCPVFSLHLSSIVCHSTVPWIQIWIQEGWNVSPQIHMLKFQPPGPQNGTVYGEKVVEEVIKLMKPSGWGPNPTRLVSL